MAGGIAPAVDEEMAQADGKVVSLNRGGLLGKCFDVAATQEIEKEVLHGVLGGLRIAAALAGEMVEPRPVGAAKVIVERRAFSSEGR